jgi:hypothetical protein
MPVSSGEKRGFVGFGIGLLLLMTLVAWLNTENRDQGEGFPSSYSTLRHGAKAAYLLLQQSGYPVERWEQSPAKLPGGASDVTLVLAGPESYPRADERSGIARFLFHGGRVLIVGKDPDGFVSQAGAEYDEMRIGKGSECQPFAPTHLTRGGAISQDGDLIWDHGSESKVVHFIDKNGKPVVVSYALGSGQVIWWASAAALTNVGIRDRGNLDLLLNSLGDSKRILWDEYYHREHSAEVMGASNPAKMWMLAQAAFLALLVVLTFSRRSGPVVALATESRRSPLEFVETLGSVFHRAGSTQVAVEIAFGRFQQIAARRLGIRGSASSDEIVLAMAQRGIKIPPDLASLVRSSEEAASDSELSEQRALDRIKALNRATGFLDPQTSPAQTSPQRR